MAMKMCDVMCSAWPASGRDESVAARGAQPEGRVDRIVVAVDEVVQHAGMLRMRRQNFFEQRRRAHVGGEIAALMGSAEEGESVEGGSVDVVGIAFVHDAHRIRVLEIALVFRAVAVKNFDRAKVVALALRLRFCQTIGRRCAEFLQHRASGIGVLLKPDRMRVRHRLAPIGHRERGLDRLRFPECLRRRFVLEVVEQRQTAQKRRLRLGRARVCEGDLAGVVLGIRVGGEEEGEENDAHDWNDRTC